VAAYLLVSVEIGGAVGKPQVLRLRRSGFAQDDTFYLSSAFNDNFKDNGKI
jgi:hypothetical protein